MVQCWGSAVKVDYECLKCNHGDHNMDEYPAAEHSAKDVYFLHVRAVYFVKHLKEKQQEVIRDFTGVRFLHGNQGNELDMSNVFTMLTFAN
ncbi:hypothetical protein Nepgr_030188 [Nepenthes gracilis]|uniref:Uncharacterized protein n=1 Tax=Nepenthes gracilis TaxID=150966 RepID=A0AAD3TEX1_NEPGR|nr:hypothetical protein Nepgr_030188 [Nepenthes gracilis]